MLAVILKFEKLQRDVKGEENPLGKVTAHLEQLRMWGRKSLIRNHHALGSFMGEEISKPFTLKSRRIRECPERGPIWSAPVIVQRRKENRRHGELPRLRGNTVPPETQGAGAPSSSRRVPPWGCRLSPQSRAGNKSGWFETCPDTQKHLPLQDSSCLPHDLQAKPTPSISPSRCSRQPQPISREEGEACHDSGLRGTECPCLWVALLLCCPCQQ